MSPSLTSDLLEQLLVSVVPSCEFRVSSQLKTERNNWQPASNNDRDNLKLGTRNSELGTTEAVKSDQPPDQAAYGQIGRQATLEVPIWVERKVRL